MTLRTRTLMTAGAALLVLLALVGSAYLSIDILASQKTVANVSAASVVSLTNDERADGGVPALARNSLLDAAAQMKAQDMAAKGYYAHVSPEGLTPMHWVDQAGYRYLIIGENLVVNRTDAGQVVDAFMGSPGHRANILRKDFTEIGVGVANGIYKGKDATFTVQIFAAPYPTAAAPAKPAVPAPVKPSVSKPAPAPAEAAVVPAVPRAAVPAAATSAPAIAKAIADNTNALQGSVTNLIRPLIATATMSMATATATTSATTTFAVPSFSLNTEAPVELSGVSRLEADTLPVPIGSTWSMELRSFLERVVLSARSLFAS